MRSTALAKYIFILTVFIICASVYSCNNPPPEGTVVTISLPKKTYKMHEPIELVYQWINYKDTPDSIWALFDSPQIVLYNLYDDKGNHFTYSNFTEATYTRPTYIIGKEDTLIKTVTLNMFGKHFDDRLKESYFSNHSFLPPGRYTVSAIIEGDIVQKYKTPIATNEISFEVAKPDEADNGLMNLVKEKKYYEALQLYPSSYFDEYLMYFDLSKYILDFYRAGEMNTRFKDTSVLPLKYNAFFEKYPNSLYNFKSMFIVHYLRVSSRDSAGAHVKMNELLEKYPETSISATVREIIKMEMLTGRSIIYIRGYHIKNGESEEVKPSPIKEK